MAYTTLFFDLDDTLYRNTNGLWDAIRERMTGYMYDRLDLPPEQVPALRRSYYENYGTTLRGLQIHHDVDVDDYLAYVHDLPLQDYLRPDPELKALLRRLPQARWIFTNADNDHARRVLAVLDLEDCFNGVIDVRAMDFYCKPETKAYRIALQIAGGSNPDQCVMLDDSPANLAPARAMGFTTILVGKNCPHPSAHHAIPRLHDLPAALPELWNPIISSSSSV
jgi:putative hydrolase of the HAD superfamily